MIEQTRDASAAMFHSVTEDELASWRCNEGYRVSAHRGRFWMKMPRGFLQSLHGWRAFPVKKQILQQRSSWGFRAVVSQDEAEAANGALCVYVLSDVAGYTEEPFVNAPQRLRRCHKRAANVEPRRKRPLDCWA